MGVSMLLNYFNETTVSDLKDLRTATRSDAQRKLDSNINVTSCVAKKLAFAHCQRDRQKLTHLHNLTELYRLLRRGLQILNREDLQARLVDLSSVSIPSRPSIHLSEEDTDQLRSLLHVRTLQPRHNWRSQVHGLHHTYQPLRNSIAPYNTPEYVNEDGSDFRIACYEVESLFDGLRCGASAYV